MGIVRYIAPGFGLAKAAAEVFEQSPDVEGLILHKHGIFTFGETAREAYERMIEMVSLAESRLRQGRPVVFQARTLADELAEVAEIAPIIRGAVALPADKPGGEPTRFVMTFRTGPEILAYVNGAELADYSQRGVVTPDHIIRTKNTPLVVSPPEPGRLDEFARHVKQAVAEFSAGYDSYFGRENEKVGGIKSKLELSPARGARAGAWPIRHRAERQGRRHRRGPRREHGARGDRRRRHRPLRAAAGERSVRARILEPGAGQAEGCGGQAADRAGGAGDRRRRHRQRYGEGACRRRRGRRHRRYLWRYGKEGGEELQGAWAAMRRDQARGGARRLRQGVRALRRRRHRRVECRRRLAGPHRRRLRRAACARASSSISSPIRPWRRRRCASC